MRNIILNHRNTALCNQCWWAFCVILDNTVTSEIRSHFLGRCFHSHPHSLIQIRRPRQAQIQCCCTVTDEISVSELVNVNEPLTRNTCTWNSPMVPMTAVSRCQYTLWDTQPRSVSIRQWERLLASAGTNPLYSQKSDLETSRTDCGTFRPPVRIVN